MMQFEEQMTAAKVVSPATRPLNLYYGLTQAGMAIAAAHAPDPWSFGSHGLRLVDPQPELADMQVRTEGDGAFQRVAAATGSPGITTPVSLGALWSSVPELCGAQLPGPARPVALDLLSSEMTSSAPRATLYLTTEMPARPAWLERFGEIMADYPGAKGHLIPMETDAIQAIGEKRWSVTLEWPTPDPSRDLFGEELKAFFDGIAPEHRYRNDRYLRPSVEDSGVPPPSPLMTWWLLLFSFSILARYQPRKWVHLLDLDKPGCAASLQYALEVALSALPHLVLEALDGEPFLLSKPLAL